jgi:hypothetical protein
MGEERPDGLSGASGRGGAAHRRAAKLEGYHDEAAAAVAALRAQWVETDDVWEREIGRPPDAWPLA